MDLVDGKFELIERIGVGGQGEVWKARNVLLDQFRALKFLAQELVGDEGFRAQLITEAKVMARFNHPNIVRVYDIVRRDRDGHPNCLVMDFIDGPTLKAYAREHGALPGRDAVEIAYQVASALDHAHGFRVWHRDVKPGNVLIASTRPWRVMLTDFGIAKVDSADASEQTKTGQLKRTPRYSAPEQNGYKRGRGRDRVRVAVDQRTDVFALGLVLFELLEGRQFFADLDDSEIIGALAYDPDPLAIEFLVPVEPRVRAIVARAIQRDPEDRFQTMAAMRAALEKCREVERPVDDDDDRTTVVTRSSGASTGERSPSHDWSERSDDELKAQREHLEREVHRRQAQRAAVAATAARERAAAADAVRWAADGFGAAKQAEADAAAALDASRFDVAVEQFGIALRGYDEAANLAQSAAEAERKRIEAERVRREADRARGAAVEAREAARVAGAAESAADRLERAEAVDRSASAAFDAGDHAAAAARWNDAVRAYDAARESAVAIAEERAREAAIGARDAVAAARKTAVAAGSEARAGALLKAGDERRGVADDAFAGRRYDAAAEAFREAATAFEKATAEANRVAAEEARQARIAEARSDADHALRDAVAAGAREFAASDMTAAEATFEAARRRTDDGGDALEAAWRAARTQLVAVADVARRRHAERSRAAAGAAREAARAAGAAETAADPLKQADALDRSASTAFEAGDHGAAASRWNDAVNAYEAARESAVAIAEAQAREAATRSREAAGAAREVAVAAKSDVRAGALMTAADERHRLADGAFADRRYGEAAEGFRAAATAFEKAATEAGRVAVEEARQAGIAEARSAAEQALRDAVTAGARELAATDMKKAEAAFEAAGRRRDDGGDGLEAAWRAAGKVLVAAAAVAHEQRAQKEAELDRAAEAAREEAANATAAGAEQWADDLLGQGTDILRAAAERRRRGEWRHARVDFERAAAILREAAEVASTRQAEARVAEERARDGGRKAIAARDALAGTSVVHRVPSRWAEAERALRLAGNALQAGAFAEAEQGFADAMARLEAAESDARRIEAEEARRTRDAPSGAADVGDDLAGAEADDRTVVPPPALDVEGDAATVIGRAPGTELDDRTVVPPPALDVEGDDATVIGRAPGAEIDDRTVVPPLALDVEGRDGDATEVGRLPDAEPADLDRTVVGPSPAISIAETRAKVPTPPVPPPTGTQHTKDRSTVPPPRVDVAPAKPSRGVPMVALVGGGVLLAAGLAYFLIPGKTQSPGPVTQKSEPPATVAVTQATTPATIPPPPPRLAWSQVSPQGETATVKEGERLQFTASTGATDAGEVRYVWTVDDERVGTDSKYVFAPDFAGQGGRRTIKVVATAGQQPPIDRTWIVSVENVNRPPVITAPEQTRSVVDLSTDAGRKLSVDATDPDGDALTYTWERNGKEVASGASPQWTVQDAKQGDEIQVVVTDRDKASVSRTWVVGGSREPVNLPPVIASRDPSGKALKIAEGQSQDFTIDAKDPNASDRLGFSWRIGDQKVGEGRTWKLTSPYSEWVGRKFDLTVDVSDQAGGKASSTWSIEVTGEPPVLGDVSPRAPEVAAVPGEATTLSVSGTAAKGGKVRYEWSLDGARMNGGDDGHLTLPNNLSGRHVVQVVAVDERRLRSDPRRWTVDFGRPSPPPTVDVARGGGGGGGGGGVLSEADARQWLAGYQAAYQGKDAAELARMGAVSAADAERLRKVFEGWGRISVKTNGVEVQSADGTGARSVSFQIVVRDEDQGRELPPRQMNFRLERQGGHVVAVR